MAAQLTLIAFATLFVITLALGLGYAIVHRLYFSGGVRRRMPSWLIVLVLIAFLTLPKLDTFYIASRAAERQAIHE
jgi:hypothetical protein